MSKASSVNSPSLSVIIPCYNCAPVITRCLDSIDYPDCEIIVVNDGSTDNTIEVIEQYCQRLTISDERLGNGRIRLINKENGGASSARNMGIEHAKGKYIVFVDADDYLSQGGLERMIELAEEYQADIVKYKINSLEYDATCIYNSVADTEMTVEVISGKAQALNRYDISDYHVVDAVFKRAVVVDNDIRFHTDLHLHEDDAFMGAFYSVASQVVITDLLLYNYYTASYYSSTHRQTIERKRLLIQSGLIAIQQRKAFIAAHCPGQKFPYERLKYMRWVCSMRSAVEARMTYREYKDLLEEYRKEGVYPLDYAWIKISGWDYAWRPYMKRAVRTLLMNHPWLGWPLAKLKYGRNV